jgi:hypothetical protein
MIIQFFLLLVLSAVVVIWPSFISYLLHMLHGFYFDLSHWLGLIFSHTALGSFIQSILALLILPLLLGLIYAGMLKLMKKGNKNTILRVMWVIWMLLAVTIVLV